MKEDYQAVLDYAGHGKKVVGFPAAPAIWGLSIGQTQPLALYKWVYETASKDSFVSIERPKGGYAPKYSNKEALLRNFRWYLENRQRFEGLLRRLAPRALGRALSGCSNAFSRALCGENDRSGKRSWASRVRESGTCPPSTPKT